MKNKVGLLIILFMIFSCFLLASCSSRESSKIRRIYFDEILAPAPNMSSTEFVWEISDELFEKDLMIYKKANDKEDLIALLKEKYNFSGRAERSYETQIFKNDAGSSLSLYDSGPISFSTGKESSRDPIEMTRDEVLEASIKILNELKINMDQFKFRGYGYGKIQRGGDEEYEYQLSASFGKYIDSYPVVGNSRIVVSFEKDYLSDISISYSDVVPDFKITTISFDEAREIFESGNMHFSTSDLFIGNAKKITIDKVEIVYAEHSFDIEETHVQPCYRFGGTIAGEGTTDVFSALISAVPSKYTFD